MISTIVVQNLKGLKSFEISLNADVNMIVGDNEAGKSTILQAVNLALTGRINGRLLDQEMSPNLFNRETADAYVAAIRANQSPQPPSIVVELYLEDREELQPLKGTNNSKRADLPGVRIEISLDQNFAKEYADLLMHRDSVSAIPTEYYKSTRTAFSGNPVKQTDIPISCTSIDAANIRLQSGMDYYIQNVVAEELSAKERADLSVTYRKLKEQFSAESSIQTLNRDLPRSTITNQQLSIAIDIGQKTSWQATLSPYVGGIPFSQAGSGEQTALKILLALERKAKAADILLIEEPENHLSFSSMARLLTEINAKCTGKQILVATHSAYVLNRLGVEKVTLVANQATTSLKDLPPETQTYFRKLSGYDTLRLILAKKAILVEGPSDELVVQKAYIERHQKSPIDDGVDVINVRGLSAPRFLDIARILKNHVAVVTDNDGDYQKHVVERYAPYSGVTTIKVCADNDNAASTLELQILKHNQRPAMNGMLGTSYTTDDELKKYMLNNKTDWALKLLDSSATIIYPRYILDAVG